MYDIYVKKLIARYGERELVDSSAEEQQRFIVDRERPDFEDESILCIKFLQSDNESMEAAEESSWFINPCYVQGFAIYNRIPSLDAAVYEQDEEGCLSYVDADETTCYGDVDDEVAMEFASTFGYSPNESYGPKMAAEFLPEILVLQPKHPDICILTHYQRFYAELLKYNLSTISHEDKLKLFNQFMQCKRYCERPEIFTDYLKNK